MRIAFLPLALALAVTIHAKEGDALEYHLAPTRAFPTRTWKKSEKEAETWKGPFAPALRTMLEAGLPDPSGLPYHNIGISTGNCYTGFDGITRTEGWLLPAKPGEPVFAIAWNGLVYPVVEDKGAADFKERVVKITKVGEKDRAAWHDTGEATQVTPDTLSLIHGLYLTRLGETDAADYLLKNREQPLKAPPLESDLALDWVWNLYERAVCAHMRGDPRMALASLTTCKQAIAGLEKPLKQVDGMFGNVKSWNEDLLILEKDCERRLEAGKIGIFDPEAFLAEEQSVQDLIDALDRIALPQDGQPGDVPLWESLVVKALVAKGDSAVEPLLQCLTKDPRLTQSVHFWRSHHKSRTILGVHEAALYALQSVLDADFFDLASTGDSLSARDPEYRTKLAALIRADWEKYGRTTGPSRTFRMLADDTAGIDAWMQAGSSLFHITEYDEESGEPIPPSGPIPGEPLRVKRDPSVSDLLEKRAAEAGRLADTGDVEAGHGRMALLAILLDWDEKRGRAAIGKLAARWLESDTWNSEKQHVLQQFIGDVADKCPEVLAVFEAMAWSLSPGKYTGWSHASGFVTSIYEKHGASLKRKGLWTDPESPWCLTNLSDRRLEDVVGYWKEQELTDKQPFRAMVASLLTDATECGEVYIEEDNPKHWWLRGDENSGGPGLPENAKLGLKPGESLPVRCKDVAGKALKESRFIGDEPEEPVLEYYWSLEDRDTWLAKVSAEFNSSEQKAPGNKGE